MSLLHSQSSLFSTGELRLLVGRIRGYLTSRDQTGDDSIRELWRRYVDTCRQINERLDSCAQLLERGEWIEALRSAELEPDLFDCIAVLDFSGRTEWEQMGVDHGWERLVPVSPAISERLQEAWEHRKRLRPLLKEHLRLSVGRAPLQHRLRVMQQLADKDRMSTFWRDDIQALERARGPQLIRDMQQALRERNLASLSTLLAEVRETPWTLKHPPLLRKLERETEVILLDQKMLPELAERMQMAASSQDVASAAILFEDWSRALETLDQLIQPRPPQTQSLLRDRHSVIEWAARASSRRQATDEWRAAVDLLYDACQDQTQPFSTLRTLRDRAQQLGRNLTSAQRQEGYDQKAESAFQERKWIRMTHLAINGALIGAGILVPGALILIYFRWLFS